MKVFWVTKQRRSCLVPGEGRPALSYGLGSVPPFLKNKGATRQQQQAKPGARHYPQDIQQGHPEAGHSRGPDCRSPRHSNAGHEPPTASAARRNEAQQHCVTRQGQTLSGTGRQAGRQTGRRPQHSTAQHSTQRAPPAVLLAHHPADREYHATRDKTPTKEKQTFRCSERMNQPQRASQRGELQHNADNWPACASLQGNHFPSHVVQSNLALPAQRVPRRLTFPQNQGRPSPPRHGKDWEGAAKGMSPEMFLPAVNEEGDADARLEQHQHTYTRRSMCPQGLRCPAEVGVRNEIVPASLLDIQAFQQVMAGEGVRGGAAGLGDSAPRILPTQAGRCRTGKQAALPACCLLLAGKGRGWLGCDIGTAGQGSSGARRRAGAATYCNSRARGGRAHQAALPSWPSLLLPLFIMCMRRTFVLVAALYTARAPSDVPHYRLPSPAVPPTAPHPTPPSPRHSCSARASLQLGAERPRRRGAS
ncbi:hypothetical protein E2C01_005635 [Portunus trituberculatus]|uniref:Uncharacterized protein n=1 Tax=Portunus trituberculatus TaxID=210409 RepID=A0A5B7CU02_PORTR|nr:hypothetical protein [Portunus trituberculatus]